MTTSIRNVFAIYCLLFHIHDHFMIVWAKHWRSTTLFMCDLIVIEDMFEVKIKRFTGFSAILTIIVLGTFVAFCPPFEKYNLVTLQSLSESGGGASDPGAAVTSVPRHAARVDLPAARVHEVRGVDCEAALERRGARVAGVRPAHLPPDGRGRPLHRHEARHRQLRGRRE